MESIGYALSSEEFGPRRLVELAQRAEALGFEFAMISDHYHPWVAAQGQSPFVWATLGAIASATERLRVGTGVTCPLMRIHPAIIAQAAATTASLFGGRFFLGLGAGENLNEHILGDAWPPVPRRHAMLVEAIDIMVELWSGETLSYDGEFYRVDEARLFTLPEAPPAVYLAATGPRSARMAAEITDGLVGVAPDSEMIRAFDRHTSSRTLPKIGQLTVCWADSEADARKTFSERWPQSGLGGNISWELKTQRLFEDACKPLTEEQIVGRAPVGPDPDRFLEAVHDFEGAGYTDLYFHQVGPDQEGFFRFFERELLPRL